MSRKAARESGVRTFQAIADLARDGTFKYGGRTSEAKQIFLQNEEYEKMLAGEQTAQAALDNAVKRADEAISQALGN